jgi:hypothetical protein
MIPSQSVDTPIGFYIDDFGGSITDIWGDALFDVWYDPDVKVRNVNKPGVAINLITVSGTIEVNYNRSPVPIVHIHAFKKEGDNWWDFGDWIAATRLFSPRADSDVPWSIVIPAFASNTAISFSVQGRDRNDAELFATGGNETIVRNANITGINFKLGDMKK